MNGKHEVVDHTSHSHSLLTLHPSSLSFCLFFLLLIWKTQLQLFPHAAQLRCVHVALSLMNVSWKYPWTTQVIKGSQQMEAVCVFERNKVFYRAERVIYSILQTAGYSPDSLSLQEFECTSLAFRVSWKLSFCWRALTKLDYCSGYWLCIFCTLWHSPALIEVAWKVILCRCLCAVYNLLWMEICVGVCVICVS